MNDINSKEFKRKYIKSKLMLRRWENEFLAENGRLPTKDDIKFSSDSIRQHYRLYYKLKSQILECQILGGGETNLESDMTESKSDGALKEYINSINGNREKNQDHSRMGESAVGVKCDTACEKNDAKVWGVHLNRAKTASAVESEKRSLLTESIADRLFKGSSFKKRNPRKSLSFSKKRSNKSINSDEIKSVGSPDASLVMSPYSDCPNDGDQSLNGSVFSVENDCSPNIKALITSSTSLSPLLNKSHQYRDERTIAATQPISLIQVVASDPSVVLKPSRSLDVGWVKRCAQACEEAKEEGKSSDSGFDSIEFSRMLEESKEDEESSDDDVIAGSDNELDDNRLLCNFISQKRKLESSPVQEPIGGEEITTVRVECKRAKVDVSVEEETKLETKEEEMKKAILEKKIKSGRLNENYVKINLKKKVFVRGKKNFNFARHKKKVWKSKKKDLDDGRESGGVVQCYRCGESGHFGRQCQRVAEDKLLEEDSLEIEELPTLEEAEKMAEEKAEENHLKKRNVLQVAQPQAEDSFLRKVDPLYRLKEDGTLQETPPEVRDALAKFGHSSFRPGQEEAIMRILSGQSTLLTVATGGGKTLCYQLPAYLYATRTKCITLVVSPLVSLMEDQVSGSSSFFKVGCLHTSQTQKQREAVIEDAKSGKLFALLLSPETVVAGDFSSFSSVFRQLPPVAFVCIDEVHCVSQWSHNFRPSYLMISKVVREKLGIGTVLGLTATATISTISSIAGELGIDEESGVIKDVPLPDNLHLSVSREEQKDEALIKLLQSPQFKDASAILVYCTRRDECERLAVYIRTRLQELGMREGRGARSLSWEAEAYHAGMAAGRRRQVQRAFMRGNLRIVVATVAFGMGINKRDIRGVVHYNMPRDLESYVQEVGRAGRDGEAAFCHMFLDAVGKDMFELRRHVHANSADRHVLRRLLQRVFRKCHCEGQGKKCGGHEVAFDCAETVQALDVPEENIYTLLSYLELNETKYIKILAPAYIKCKIKSYKGLKEIISAAKRCPPLAYACALRSEKEMSDTVEFDVIELADKLGWDSGAVKSQLKKVEWESGGAGGKWRRTGIGVEFFRLGFRVCSRGDMTPFELDEALDYLIRRVESQEKRSLAQLDVTFSTFDHFAESYEGCLKDLGGIASQGLKKAVRKYFETEELACGIYMRELQAESFDEDAVAADVRTLICTYRDNAFNGRAVARIFHGIQSPNYPASLWFKCKFWRKHIDKDFNKISRLATVEILRLKI